LLPARLLHCSVRGERVWPHWLGDADQPWLQVLLDELAASAGQPERLLDGRLQTAAGLAPVQPFRRALAIHVGRGLFEAPARDRLPRAIRRTLFSLAATGMQREAALDEGARLLGIPATEIATRLFGDLPGERRRGALPEVSPTDLARRVNLRLAQALVARSVDVRIRLVGRARAIVRHAKLRGLLCTVRESDAQVEAGTLELSGPLALFHHTQVYGRSLAELVPSLAWCERFALEAHCRIRDRDATLVLTERDPLFPSAAPRRFDSKIEARFARDLAKHAPDWELVREPSPIRCGESLFFPDFALRHRPSQRAVLVEIVGYWTAEYLARKRAQLVASGRTDILLCVDDSLGCDDSSWPEGLAVLRFRKRVDPRSVLSAAAVKLGICVDA